MTTNDELRALAEAATPLSHPQAWEFRKALNFEVRYAYAPGRRTVIIEGDDSTAHFIAAANPQRVLALLGQLDAVKRLAKEGIEAARQQPDDYSGDYHEACGIDGLARDILEVFGE